MKSCFEKNCLEVMTSLLVVIMVMIAVLQLGSGQARAAGSDTTDNPSVASPSYQFTVLPIMGNFSGASTKVGVATFRAHWPMRFLTCHTATRYTSSNSARLKARIVMLGYTSAFSNMSTSGQIVSDAVNKNIADEGNIRVDIMGPGAGITAKDVTLDIAFKRR